MVGVLGNAPRLGTRPVRLRL